MNGKENARRTSSVFSGTRFIMVAIFAVIFCASEAMPEDKGKAPLSRFNREQLKKLQAGEPVCVYKVDSETSGNGQCSIIINAPIDKCFEILMKIDRQVYWMPGKKKSNIVSHNGDNLLIENEYYAFGITIKYHSIFTIQKQNYRIEWEIDKSKPHDVTDNSGFYLLEKIDEKTTLLTYVGNKADFGITVPEFMKKFFLSRSMPTIAINAKKYIESDEKWRQEK